MTAMVELARKNAAAIAAGHSFILFLGDGFYPLNVLNTLKMVPEVCRIFCATANPTEVIVAETEPGSWNPGRGGWVLAQGRRGRGRHRLAEGVPCGRSDTSCEQAQQGTARREPARSRRWKRGSTFEPSSCSPAW